MNRTDRFLLALAVAVAAAPAAAYAHFKLVTPASWLVESDRGDPQKAGPCGGDAKSSGTPSNLVDKVIGGQKLHLQIRETVYHPGHYRVALAVNSHDELPSDPETHTRDTEKGPYSVSAVIQDPPRIPVLADGLFVHDVRPSTPATFEADLQLPNINCKKCTLQVVQFMANHGYNNPGGYSYHHCADLEITADPAKPIDEEWLK